MDSAPQLTLKQKWNDHWDTRSRMLSPSKQTNVLAMLFFWTFTFSLMYTGLSILIPQLFSTDSYDDLRYWLSLGVYFVFTQSSLNWLLAARPWTSKVTSNNVFKDGVSHMDGLPEGWRNCVTCQVDAPPRAHHCKICNMCVLKRDHHCFFTGTCVGFGNQRNFIVFMFYIAIGSVFGIVLIAAYLLDTWPLFSSQGFNFLPFVAFWKLITGNMYPAQFFLLLQFYVCCCMFLASGWFFVLEMYTVLMGITWHEAEKGISRYQGVNTASNLRSVFGPYWLLQFVLPIPTQPEGNAYQWENKKGTKTN